MGEDKDIVADTWAPLDMQDEPRGAVRIMVRPRQEKKAKEQRLKSNLYRNKVSCVSLPDARTCRTVSTGTKQGGTDTCSKI